MSASPARRNPASGARLGGQFRRLLCARHHRSRSRPVKPPFRALHFGRARGAPDIDVDFEHEKREEAIQYVYNRFGRHRAGLCATVICYRTRGAVREVGKALGLSPMSRRRCGLDLGLERGRHRSERACALVLMPRIKACALPRPVRQLIGFPRHLSQHPGGFLIARGRLDELVPIEYASMEERPSSPGTKTTSKRLVC